jgi:hypothetical protein
VFIENLLYLIKICLFADRDRRETLVDIYNVQFNSIRLREFDGSHLNLKDKSPEIKMRDHQLNAVAKSLYGGNTLLAHEVGAGKSYTMIATAMEGKRLGLHRKSLFVVPNHLTRQMGNDFLKLYPNANILVADKEDFKKENRKAFFARIATGEYDAVIIGHSQFERMSLSVEQQKKFMQHEISKFEAAKLELAGDNSDTGKRFTKALEKSLENYRVRLEKLMEQIPDDSVIDFEQLGIDKLFVDESHMFKNLETKSKFARGVAGMGNAHSNRAFDMFMKCSYLNEVTHGKGIVMSTGTPISNTLTEMYTLMRYMMPESELIKMKLDTFDKWASTFGQITTAMELKPESDGGYQMKTRFSKFDNLPELFTIFKTFADVQTHDTLKLERPTLVGIDKDGNRVEGKCTDVVAKPSRIQRKFIRELGERASLIREGHVPPEEDNMLCITSDGRKIGLDQRIIDPTAPDNPNSKVNMCVDRIAEIYHSTAEKKGTQLLFCDMSTPSAAKDGGFCLYHDIKAKLIAKGVKEEEIAFIHDCKSDEEKQNLYNKMTEGEIRVMLGSTTMCGAGMNAQKRMVALHDLDAPMRPSDMEQRHGRILRQGNDNKEVQIFRYVSDKTFDSYMYQMLETKQGFIGQIMTSKAPARQCDEIDEQQLDFGEVKALCAGNPLIKEKMELESDLANLKTAEKSYNDNRYRLQNQAEIQFPNDIAMLKANIERFSVDKEAADKNAGNDIITVNGVEYDKYGTASVAITAECFKLHEVGDSRQIGMYKGFKMYIQKNDIHTLDTPPFSVILKGSRDYVTNIHITTAEEAKSGGVMRSVDALVKSIDRNLEKTKAALEGKTAEWEQVIAQAKEPFKEREELNRVSDRLEQVNKLLTESDNEMKLPIELYTQVYNIAPSVLDCTWLDNPNNRVAFTTSDGFGVTIEKTMDGNIEIADLEGNFCVECKEHIAFNSENEASHALVLAKFTNNIEGTVVDYLTPDPVSGVKSMPSKEELDFVNDFIDCADCGEFVECHVPERGERNAEEKNIDFER